MQQDSDHVLGIRDLAKRLNVSQGTVLRWEKIHALPPRRVFAPGVTGWISGEISEWLRSRPMADVAA